MEEVDLWEVMLEEVDLWEVMLEEGCLYLRLYLVWEMVVLNSPPDGFFSWRRD
jgi:hypothetical protein